MDDSVRETFEENIFFRSIVTIIAASEKARPKEESAQDRLTAIFQRLSAELEKSGAPVVWRNVFHAKGADYYDFEIGADRYCLRRETEKIARISGDALEAASPLASARIDLSPVEKGAPDWAEVYSDLILKEAISEGRFFAVKDIPNIPIDALFAGTPREMAERFAQNIMFHDESQRAAAVEHMAGRLGDPRAVERLRRAFEELQRVALQVKNKPGVRNLESRRIGILLDVEGVVPFMYTRTEEGRPMNILARAGKRYNSIYFSLEALDYYQKFSKDPSESVGAVIRVENALLENTPDFLTRSEQRLLDTLEERYLMQRVVAHTGLWDDLRAALSTAILRAKAAGVTGALLKKPVEDSVKELFGSAAHVQWHCIESRDGYEHILLTVSGRRFFFSYDEKQRRVDTDFGLLDQLYQQLCEIIGSTIPDYQSRTDLGSSWEDLSEKIAYLYAENRERLERRGRRDIIALLEYAMQMDYSNGYLDELRYLTKKIRDAGDVPPLFTLKPLEEKEFILLQVIEGPVMQPDGLPEILEISAVQYRGMKIIRRFHTFVRTPRNKKIEEAAFRKGIDPAALMRRGLPSREEALARLRQFLGDLPIVTHGGLAKRKTLNDLYAAQGDQPLANSVLDTLSLARKYLRVNTKRYPYDKHSMPVLFEHFGFGLPRDKVIRSFRLLRLYGLLVQELACCAKLGTCEAGEKLVENPLWEYKRLLDHFVPPERKAQQADFEKYEKEFPGRIMEVKSWGEIRGIVMATDPGQGGVELIALDFDNTIARSKGWIGSDDWFRWEIRYQDQYGGEFFRHIDQINKVLTQISFFEPMEPGIADVVKRAREKGIKVILLTARQPWPGHREFLYGALRTMGIEIDQDDLVLTGTASGSVDKPGGLYEYCLRTFKRVPNILFMDDGLKYHPQMAKHEKLGQGMKFLCWYNSPTSKPLDFSYREFLKRGEDLLRKDPAGGLYIGYLLNAFGLAQGQAGNEEALTVAENILRMLSDYNAAPKMLEFMRWYVTSTIRNDPELILALLLREVGKKKPGERIMFNDFFEQIRQAWGDISLADQHQRYIVTDSRLRRERDLLPLLGPDNKLVGVKILAYKTPLIREVTVTPDQKKIAQEKQSKRADRLRRKVNRALGRLAGRPEQANNLRRWVSSLNLESLAVLEGQLSRLEETATEADVFKVLEDFLRLLTPKKAQVIELHLRGLRDAREAA